MAKFTSLLNSAPPSQTTFRRFVALDELKARQIAVPPFKADFLEEKRVLSVIEFAELANESRENATRALQKLCSQGRAMWDSKIEAYRWRQLLPFPAPDSPEDAKARSARRWVAEGKVEVETIKENEIQSNEFLSRYDAPGISFNRAEVRSEGGTFRPLFARDLDGRVRFWQCTCGEFRRDKGRSGPCAHLLAALGELEGAKA